MSSRNYIAGILLILILFLIPSASAVCNDTGSDGVGDSVITVDTSGACTNIQNAVNNASDSHSQTNHLGGSYDSDTTTRFGEKINITKGITIDKVGFYCERDGSDLGTGYIRVRYCSNDTIMHSTSFDADSISTGQTWNEIALNSPVTVPGDTCVRVMMEHSGGFDYIRWRNGDFSATDDWGTGSYYAGGYSTMDPASYYINYSHSVKIEPGTYMENVDVSKPYTKIVGNGTMSGTVINPSTVSTTVDLASSADHSSIKNVTIDFNQPGPSALLTHANHVTVEYVNMSRHTTGLESYGDYLTVKNSVVYDAPDGNYVEGNNSVIEDTTIDYNINDGYGLNIVSEGGNVTLNNLDISDASNGAVRFYGKSISVTNSTVYSNGRGIYIEGADDCVVRDNTLYNSGDLLDFASGVTGLTFENNTIGDGAYSTVINDISDLTGSLTISDVTSPPSDPQFQGNINKYLNISGIGSGEYLEFLVEYDDADIPANTLESDLSIWRYDGSWTDTGFYSDQLLDTANNLFGANVTSSSTFAPLVQQPFTPPALVDMQNATGNFYIQYSWNPGSGNITDSYNVSVDATNNSLNGWHNGTTDFFNCTGLGAHGYCDVSVNAYNDTSTGTLNTTPLSDNMTVPNNPIHITNISDASVVEGDNISMDFDYSDLDPVDTGTFDTNATQGSLNTDTGEYTWNTAVGDNGTYYWMFNVSDGHGSTDEYVALIDVVNATDVGKPINLRVETGNFWINWSWEPGVNTETFNITKDNGDNLNDTTQQYYNASLSSHDYWNISVRGWNASVTGDRLSSPSSGVQQIPNNPIDITNVASPTVYESNPVSIDFGYSDVDGDTGTFATNAAQGDFNTTTGEFTWTPVEDENGNYEWTFNVSDSWGSVDEYTTTITVKKDGYVTDLPAGRWVLLYGDSSTDVTKTVVDTTDWIVLGNDQYQNYAAAAQVNLTTNVSFADVLIDTDRDARKSVFTGLDNISEVQSQRLLIPRTEDTGTVVVCPNASTLDEVSEGCTNSVKINTGETVDGMTVTEVTLGTQEYYSVSNITGTGGIEFTPKQEEEEPTPPPEDGGEAPPATETPVAPPPPSPGEQPAPLPVIIGVFAAAAIILGLYFFARG